MGLSYALVCSSCRPVPVRMSRTRKLVLSECKSRRMTSDSDETGGQLRDPNLLTSFTDRTFLKLEQNVPFNLLDSVILILSDLTLAQSQIVTSAARPLTESEFVFCQGEDIRQVSVSLSIRWCWCYHSSCKICMLILRHTARLAFPVTLRSASAKSSVLSIPRRFP